MNQRFAITSITGMVLAVIMGAGTVLSVSCSTASAAPESDQAQGPLVVDRANGVLIDESLGEQKVITSSGGGALPPEYFDIVPKVSEVVNEEIDLPLESFAYWSIDGVNSIGVNSINERAALVDLDSIHEMQELYLFSEGLAPEEIDLPLESFAYWSIDGVNSVNEGLASEEIDLPLESFAYWSIDGVNSVSELAPAGRNESVESSAFDGILEPFRGADLIDIKKNIALHKDNGAQELSVLQDPSKVTDPRVLIGTNPFDLYESFETRRSNVSP